MLTKLQMHRAGLHRRTTYRGSVFNADYFMVRHLNAFLTRQVDSLVKAGSFVADIGCGEQPLRNAIQERGARYLGVDVTQNAARTVDTIAIASQAPFAAGSFDIVFCTEVLEHLSDTFAAIQELARMLKVSGLLIVTVPFMYPLHEEPRDYVRLTHHQIRTLATTAGLEVLELKRFGNELEVMATAWCRLWPGSRDVAGGRAHRLWSLPGAMARLVANLTALAAGRLARPLLPCRAYLSTVSVLRKAGPGTSKR